MTPVTTEIVDRYFELTLRAGNRHALAAAKEFLGIP